MMQDNPILLAWTLLSLFLVVGLILYERTGMRLGGVLVLPLLIVYALFDLNILAIFAIAATISLIAGHILYNRTFLYGRRLLYMFLVVGILATIVARQYVDASMGGFVVALLPGLFAYNLHREGRYLEGTASFVMWLGIMLVAGIAAVWLFAQPLGVREGAEAVRIAGSGGPGAWIQVHLQNAVNTAYDLAAVGRAAGGAPLQALVQPVGFIPEGGLLAGATGASILTTMDDGGMAE